jgi:hypothetical protein
MGAEGTFLRDVEILVEIYNPGIRAGIDAVLPTGAFLGIDNYYSIVPLVYRPLFAGADAGRLVAVLAYRVVIGNLDLRDRSPDHIGYLHPELAGIRLRFGIWGPVVANVFVLAGDLAVITAAALVDINDKCLRVI